MDNQTKSELINTLDKLNALETAISSDHKDIMCILNIIKGDKEQIMREMKNLPKVSEDIYTITTTGHSKVAGLEVDKAMPDTANNTKTDAASSTYNGVIDLTNSDNEDDDDVIDLTPDDVIDLTEWDTNDL
jgi:hypothetical protein